MAVVFPGLHENQFHSDFPIELQSRFLLMFSALFEIAKHNDFIPVETLDRSYRAEFFCSGHRVGCHEIFSDLWRHRRDDLLFCTPHIDNRTIGWHIFHILQYRDNSANRDTQKNDITSLDLIERLCNFIYELKFQRLRTVSFIMIEADDLILRIMRFECDTQRSSHKPQSNNADIH